MKTTHHTESYFSISKSYKLAMIVYMQQPAYKSVMMRVVTTQVEVPWLVGQAFSLRLNLVLWKSELDHYGRRKEDAE